MIYDNIPALKTAEITGRKGGLMWPICYCRQNEQ
jgi:hypothetical protein